MPHLLLYTPKEALFFFLIPFSIILKGMSVRV